ncbi:MAG: hypothetical protein C7B45_16495 [Sulfobacillus acidophilus]|uniref:GGDEF domain-containing protein n=1 Tax=Sulfobacillus acidophilus TaxID=53633 RepID=A0A2T2WCX9_9FIRM|nr:MAG: hypothetical protein C7B45_16495 [Sulfobacillus acidophilus]
MTVGREIPLAVLPYLLLALLALIAAMAWSARGSNERGALVRLAGLTCLWAVISAFWLWQSRPASAADWYRWLVPMTWGMDIAAIEALALGLKLSLPAWVKGLYGVWGVALIVAIFWHPALTRDPDGVWVLAAYRGDLGLAVVAAWWILVLAYLGVRARRVDPWFRVLYYIVLSAVAAVLFNSDLWMLGHQSGWPQAWLALLLVLGMTWVLMARSTSEPQNTHELAEVINQTDAATYGDRVLGGTSAAVLVVVLERLDELSVTYGLNVAEEVSQRLGDELRHMCRQRDRVSQWQPGVFVMVFPGVPFHQERDVRARMAAAIEQLSLQIDGSTLSLSAHVQVGWAWGGRGARFHEVVSEALHTTQRLNVSRV